MNFRVYHGSEGAFFRVVMLLEDCDEIPGGREVL
jgi:hypothetical protein